MADLFEMFMIIVFGLSWPINCVKLWRSRTTKGVTAVFYCLIMLGYLFGIISKVIKLQEGVVTPIYVWFFYILNLLMVAACLVIFFRNRALERRQREQA